MKKVSITLVEKTILENSDDIIALDDKSLPMLLVELQAEQAKVDKVDDHKSITEICRDVIEEVLFCWSNTSEGEKILNILFS